MYGNDVIDPNEPLNAAETDAYDAAAAHDDQRAVVGDDFDALIAADQPATRCPTSTARP